jgi:hypothetical protein
VDSPFSPNSFDFTLAFEREPNRLACAYWQSRCEGRAMPTRADLNPVAMKAFTPHISIVELRPADPGTDYFLRRAGARWEDVYGAMTGKYMHDILPPHLLPCWQEIFEAATSSGKPVRVTTQVDFEGKTWLSIEMLVAPLGAEGTVNMLFVSFVSWSRAASR